MSTVRAATHALMRELGMTTVFGNPGSTELRFFRDWPDDFRYVLALQESSAVAMADGYAQATRRAAFVNLHSAVGIGHALGSVFTAMRNGAPLVLTAGQQTRAMLATDPYLFAQDATLFPRPYVKWAIEPARAADVPAAIARAYWEAMAHPQGPVFVSVPEDDWDAEAAPVAARVVHGEFTADPSALAEVAAALAGARAPALVVGPGVDRDGAWDLAVALAERTGAAAWVSPVSSRCSFPEDHAQFAGFLVPQRTKLAAQLAPHDVVVVLGAPVFTYHVHAEGEFLNEGTALFQLTDDAAAAARAPVGTAIVTTLRPALETLLKDFAQGQTLSRSTPYEREDQGARPLDPIPAAYVMAAVRRLMPEDAIVVEEAPTHRNAMHDHLPITRSGGFYVAASGGLGWGVPAAVGVALAEPERRVICLVGEGSSMYSIQALWTAAQHGLPIAFVVLDNRAYVAMKALGGAFGITDPPGVDLPGLDVAAVAEGLGVPARKVEVADDLDSALRDAFGAGGPTLTNVLVDPAVDPLY
jgi:benzoylformate decarboxylase